MVDDIHVMVSESVCNAYLEAVSSVTKGANIDLAVDKLKDTIRLFSKRKPRVLFSLYLPTDPSMSSLSASQVVYLNTLNTLVQRK